MCEPHLRLNDVELCGRIDRVTQFDRLGTEAVGQLPEDAKDLFALLLLERDDLVVDLDRAERLEIQAGAAAGAAVDNSRNRGAMLCLDDEHVAAVAIADDLILQVFRRLFSAQVRLERGAQPRALFAKLRAQSRQLGARVVVHLARWVDLAADVGDLVLERSAVFGKRLEDGEVAAGPANRCAGQSERIEELGEGQQSKRLERAAFDRQRGQHRFEIVGRLQRECRVGVQVLDAFGRRRQELRDAVRIGLGLELREPRCAERRQREAADHLDDLIPLKGAKSGIHL